MHEQLLCSGQDMMLLLDKYVYLCRRHAGSTVQDHVPKLLIVMLAFSKLPGFGRTITNRCNRFHARVGTTMLILIAPSPSVRITD